jgi:hypothetical protein
MKPRRRVASPDSILERTNDLPDATGITDLTRSLSGVSLDGIPQRRVRRVAKVDGDAFDRTPGRLQHVSHHRQARPRNQLGRRQEARSLTMVEERLSVNAERAGEIV